MKEFKCFYREIVSYEIIVSAESQGCAEALVEKGENNNTRTETNRECHFIDECHVVKPDKVKAFKFNNKENEK
jgi:hypothetical protein